MQRSTSCALRPTVTAADTLPRPDYSVIVPTYNERQNVAILVYLLHKYLADLVSFEIIFVDDNSPDGTADAVELQIKPVYPRVQLVRRPKRAGLGSAYQHGVAKALGSFIILMDADLSHHPRHLPAFIEQQRKTGADIVTSTRYQAGGGVAGWNLLRKFTSRGANLLASFLLGATVSDLTGAYRLYQHEALGKLLAATASQGYAFQMEVIIRAQYAGMRLVEVPIVFVDRIYGNSKLGWGEYLQFIRGLLRLLMSL